MDAPQLDWSTAETHPDGSVRVRWAALPPNEWLDAFYDQLTAMDNEARGQQWRDTRVEVDGVTIFEVELDGADHLKSYLAEAIDATTPVAERRAADYAAARAREDEESQKRAAEQEELQRRLREG